MLTTDVISPRGHGVVQSDNVRTQSKERAMLRPVETPDFDKYTYIETSVLDTLQGSVRPGAYLSYWIVARYARNSFDIKGYSVATLCEPMHTDPDVWRARMRELQAHGIITIVRDWDPPHYRIHTSEEMREYREMHRRTMPKRYRTKYGWSAN